MPVNTKEVAKGLAGLPSVDAMLDPKHFDNVPAVVRSSDGAGDSPAALTEGEFVISIPALVALGDGDYNKGAQMIENIHNMLREKSKSYLDDKSIAAAGLGE